VAVGRVVKYWHLDIVTLGSVDLELTASDISRLSAAIPDHAAAGDAFPALSDVRGADDATSPDTEKVTVRSPNAE
jgi:hypothetical protein